MTAAEGAIGHIQYRTQTDSRGLLGMPPAAPPHTNPIIQTLLPMEMEEYWKSLQTLHCTRQKYPKSPFRSWCFCREWLGRWQGMEQPLEWDGRGLWIPMRKVRNGGIGDTKAKTRPEPPSGSPFPHCNGAAPNTGHEGTIHPQKSLPSPHRMPHLSASPRHHFPEQLQQEEQEPSTATALITPRSKYSMNF